MTDLFDERIKGTDKVIKLQEEYGLRMTKEVKTEVTDMCSYATAIEKKGIEKGMQQGMQQGIKQGLDDALTRVIFNYMKQDPELTKEEAEKKARAILS